MQGQCNDNVSFIWLMLIGSCEVSNCSRCQLFYSSCCTECQLGYEMNDCKCEAVGKQKISYYCV